MTVPHPDAAAALLLPTCPLANFPFNALQDYNVTLPHPDAVPLERSILVPEVGWGAGEKLLPAVFADATLCVLECTMA